MTDFELTMWKKRAQTRLRMLSSKCLYKSYVYLINMYKEDLALKNLKYLTVWKKRAQTRLRMLSSKCVYKSYIYLINMYKEDLALNNQE